MYEYEHGYPPPQEAEVEELRREVEKLKALLEEKKKKKARLKDRIAKLERENRNLLSALESESGCKNCAVMEKELLALKESLVLAETDRYIEFLKERVNPEGDVLSHLREHVLANLESLRSRVERSERGIVEAEKKARTYRNLWIATLTGLAVVVTYLIVQKFVL